jgi:hypothetical protein
VCAPFAACFPFFPPVSCRGSLPTLVPQEFYAAGEFTPQGRFIASLRANLKFYLVLSAFGVGMVVYMLVTKTVAMDRLVPFVLTLSNTFGLCIIIFMLGYGLVEVPRMVWHNSNPEQALRMLEFTAPELDLGLFDCRCGLEEVVAEVRPLWLLRHVMYPSHACISISTCAPLASPQVKSMSNRLPQDASAKTVNLRACLDTVIAKIPVQLLDAAVSTSSPSASRQEAPEVR